MRDIADILLIIAGLMSTCVSAAGVLTLCVALRWFLRELKRSSCHVNIHNNVQAPDFSSERSTEKAAPNVNPEPNCICSQCGTPIYTDVTRAVITDQSAVHIYTCAECGTETSVTPDP